MIHLRYDQIVRSYGQFCPAAHALDLVGERWTLLVIRELLFGPKRYTDLQDGLPGIGPNVLAARLRKLEEAGLVAKKRLPPPAASTVYELTASGEDLRPVLHALFRWGLQVISTPAADEAVRASYWLAGIEAAADPTAVTDDVDDVYELVIGAEVITVSVKRGRIAVRAGRAESPDLVVELDPRTLIALGRGDITVVEAVAEGRITVEGDEDAAARCAAIFASGREVLQTAPGARLSPVSS